MDLDANTLLVTLNILVAFFGLLFVAVSIYEYSKLAGLRRDFNRFQNDLRHDLYKMQKAMQRVIASYPMQDLDDKIQILNEALELDPNVFNGYNALGHAYLDKGDWEAAVDAFQGAIQRHPEDKAGYFDLAHAYLKKEKRYLVRKYLNRAVAVDPSARDDIERDHRLKEVFAS